MEKALSMYTRKMPITAYRTNGHQYGPRNTTIVISYQAEDVKASYC